MDEAFDVVLVTMDDGTTEWAFPGQLEVTTVDVNEAEAAGEDAHLPEWLRESKRRLRSVNETVESATSSIRNLRRTTDRIDAILKDPDNWQSNQEGDEEDGEGRRRTRVLKLGVPQTVNLYSGQQAQFHLSVPVSTARPTERLVLLMTSINAAGDQVCLNASDLTGAAEAEQELPALTLDSTRSPASRYVLLRDNTELPETITAAQDDQALLDAATFDLAEEMKGGGEGAEEEEEEEKTSEFSVRLSAQEAERTGGVCEVRLLALHYEPFTVHPLELDQEVTEVVPALSYRYYTVDFDSAVDMLEITLTQAPGRGGKMAKRFEASYFVSNKHCGLQRVNKHSYDWRVSATEKVKRLQIHPEDDLRAQGNTFIIAIHGAWDTAHFTLSAKRVVPAPIVHVVVGQTQTLEVRGGSDAHIKVRVGQSLTRGSSMYVRASTAAAEGDEDEELCVYGAHVCIYPGEERWSWKAISSRSMEYMKVPTSLEESVLPQWRHLSDVAGAPRQQEGAESRLCQLAMSAEDMGFGAKDLYLTVGLRKRKDKSKRELIAGKAARVPVGEDRSASVVLSVVEITEEDALSGRLQNALGLFKRAIRGVNGGSASNTERARQRLTTCKEFTYGEVEFAPFTLLMGQADPQPGEVFYDLGCGTGKALMIGGMAFPFERCVGIELLGALYEEAQKGMTALHAALTGDDEEVAESAGVEPGRNWVLEEDTKTDLVGVEASITLRCEEAIPRLEGEHALCAKELTVLKGSFTEIDWSEADVIYTSSICFPDELMDEIVRIAERMKPGARFVSLKRLESPAFEILHQGFYRMSWGKNSAVCYIRKGRTRPPPPPSS